MVEAPAVTCFGVAYNSTVAGLNLIGRIGRQIQQRCILQSKFGVFQIFLLDVHGSVVEDQNDLATVNVFGEGFYP